MMKKKYVCITNCTFLQLKKTAYPPLGFQVAKCGQVLTNRFIKLLCNLFYTQKYFIIIGIFLFTVSSCVETVNFDLAKETERVIISGQLTDEFEEQVVKISKSVLLDKAAKVEETPITNAAVTIVQGTNSIFLFHTKNGLYKGFGQGQTNQNQMLRVMVDSKIYESSIEIMPTKAAPPTAKTQYILKEALSSANTIIADRKVALLLSGNIKDNDYLFIRTKGEYEFQEYEPMSTTNKSCYIPATIDAGIISLINKDILKINTYTDFDVVNTNLTDLFFTNYCFHIYQYNINKKANEYWTRVKQVLNTGNGLFEAPPGKLVGNIKNINDANEEVLGYFTVSAVNKSRIFADKSKFGGILKDPCGFNFNIPRPPACRQCLIIPDATSIKPSYWP